jgi:hypothetical protein
MGRDSRDDANPSVDEMHWHVTDCGFDLLYDAEHDLRFGYVPRWRLRF